VPVGSTLFHIERLRLLDGLIFCLEDRIIPAEIGGAITMDALHNYSIHHIIKVVLGLPIARNDVSIRADVASDRLAKMLEIKRGSPLLVREHLLSGEDGLPILYGEALYRAEFRFNYTMDPRQPADPLRFVTK
jgi:DNA-binding GntR family transcriptional regulator